MFMGGYTVFTLSIHLSFHLSATFWFILDILKSQWWNFVKLCKHIDIDKINIYNRKLIFDKKDSFLKLANFFTLCF